MKKALSYINIGILMFCVVSLNGQSGQKPEEIKQMLKTFYLKNPVEKIYVQTDRASYVAGDSIWYKVYLLERSTLEFFPLSKIIHTALVDETGNVVTANKLYAPSGRASGVMTVPRDATPNKYTFVAYTQWMKNFSEYGYFSQPITIYPPHDFSSPPLRFLLTDYTYTDTSVTATIATETQNKNTLKTIDYHFGSEEVAQMKNDDRISLSYRLPDDYDSRRVPLTLQTIVDDTVKINQTMMLPVSEDLHIRFLPEGGNLIEGLNGNVAFIATHLRENIDSLSGYIEDDEGQRYTTFSSSFQGRGVFRIRPLADKKYFAVVQYNEEELRFPLPQAQKEGLAMITNVHYPKEGFSIELQKQSGETEYFVICLSGEQPYYIAPVEIKDRPVTLQISTKPFPYGVIKVTVVDKNLNPQCERLVFNAPPNEVPIAVKTDKLRYNPREKVTVEMDIADTGMAYLSASAYNHKILSDPFENNIISYLYLSSELRGRINRPLQLFQGNEKHNKSFIDLIMMTNGWRRFKWEEKQAGHYPKPYPFETHQTLSGKLYKLNGEPARELPFISFFTSGYNAVDTSTEEAFFEITDIPPMITDTDIVRIGRIGNIVDKGIFTSKKKIFAEVETPQFTLEAEDVRSLNFEPIMLPANYASFLTKKDAIDSLQTILLNTVVATAKRPEDRFEDHNRSLMAGTSELYALTEEDRNTYTDIYDFIVANVPGVTYVFDETGQKSFRIRGDERPILIIDNIRYGNDDISDIEGVEVESASHEADWVLSSIDIAEVDYVAIDKTGFSYGRTGGAIGIYLLPYADRPSSVVSGYSTFPMFGVQPEREFYSPDYTQSATSDFPDYRAVLHWEPDIETDENGKATFSFYTPDNSGEISIRIEGVSQTGTPISTITKININEK